MSTIKDIKARQIIDSRGNPTMESQVVLSDGSVGIASCPSGASVGSHEALELRDGNENFYMGRGVTKAISKVEEIIKPKLINTEVEKQSDIDSIMIDLDGTENKSKLGANSMLSVSAAVCKAAAKSVSSPLFLYINNLLTQSEAPSKIPIPIFNLINGGKHAAKNIDFQEFQIIPSPSFSYSQSLKMASEIFYSLRNVLEKNNLSTLAGDEGGFGPNLENNMQGLSLLKKAIDMQQLNLGSDIFLGLDVAANSFYKNQLYTLKDKPIPLSSEALLAYYQEIGRNYPLLYLEDPFSEDDWNAWSKILLNLSQNTLIVGDDLTVTNAKRVRMAVEKNAINGIIIKPNQTGTITETLTTVRESRHAGLKIIVSNRSGETNDDFIADFAVGILSDYVKFGAPSRGERVAKYNRLLEIEALFQ